MNEKNKNSPSEELLEKLIEVFSKDLNETQSKFDKKMKRYDLIEAVIVLLHLLLIAGMWCVLFYYLK